MIQREEFINVLPTFNIPKIPSQDNVQVDVCDQVSKLMNQKISPQLNMVVKKIIEGLNTSSTEIRSGILQGLGGIDTAVELSVNGINTGIDVINDSTKNLNKVLVFLQSIINTDGLINTIKTIISLLILLHIPPGQVENVTYYTNAIFYFFIFIFFISPILTLIFLFL